VQNNQKHYKYKIKELQWHDDIHVKNLIHVFSKPKNKNLIIHKISKDKRYNTKKTKSPFL